MEKLVRALCPAPYPKIFSHIYTLFLHLHSFFLYTSIA
jgi:hypothetical protein